MRYDIRFRPRGGDRWYLDASWKQGGGPPLASLEELRDSRVLAVDLNADHLAACVLDSSGNPLGQPVFIPMQTTGLPASQRDGRVCASITALLDHAEHPPCAAIVVENLDFANALRLDGKHWVAVAVASICATR